MAEPIKKDKMKDTVDEEGGTSTVEVTQSNEAKQQHTSMPSVNEIFSVLQNLINIVQKGTQIHPTFIKDNLRAYGPKEIKPIFHMGELPLWQTYIFGDQRHIYMGRGAFPTDDWDSCDTYVNAMMKLFDSVFEYSRLLAYEPPRIQTSSGEIYDPSFLGIDIDGMMSNPIAQGNIVRALHNFAAPLGNMARDSLQYFIRMRSAHPVAMCNLRNAYYELIVESRRELRDLLQRQRCVTLDGVADDKYTHFIYPRVFTYPMASPVHCSQLLSSIPRCIDLSLFLLHQTVVPNVQTVPVPQQEMVCSTGQRTNSAGLLNILNTVELRSSMDTALYAFVSSFFVPGATAVMVDFSGYVHDSNTSFICACLSKLVFMYSDDPRWRNVDPESALRIDAIIIRHMFRNGLLRRADSAGPNSEFIYENFIPAGGYKGHHWEALVTHDDGRGWANAGAMYYGAESSIYEGSARRQIFMFNADQPINASNDNETHVAADNPTFVAIREVLLAFRSPVFNGVVDFVTLCYNRYITFVLGVNNYNRMHWHSGFRLTEEAMSSSVTYVDSVATVSMSAATVIVIVKNLCYESIMTRKVDYVTQFQNESAFVHDYMLYSVRMDLLVRLLQERLEARDLYSFSELVQIVFSGERGTEISPLRDFLMYLKELRLLSRFNAISTIFQDSLTAYYRHLAEFVFSRNDFYKCSDETVIRDSLNRFDDILPMVQEAAKNSAPFVMPMQMPYQVRCDPDMIQRLIMDRRLCTFFSKHRLDGIRLDLPVKFKYTIGMTLKDNRIDLSGTYDIEPAKRNLRYCFKFPPLDVSIVNPTRDVVNEDVEQLAMRIPTRMTGGFATHNPLNALEAGEDWATQLIAQSGQVHCVRLFPIEFRSILDPIDVIGTVKLNANDVDQVTSFCSLLHVK